MNRFGDSKECSPRKEDMTRSKHERLADARARAVVLLAAVALGAGCSGDGKESAGPERQSTSTVELDGSRDERPIEVAGIKLVPAPRMMHRQCQATATELGYPIFCPRLLPRGARPTHQVCSTVDWSRFMLPGCATRYQWAFSSIEFPTARREGHLVIQASPQRDSPLRFTYMGAPAPTERVVLGRRVGFQGTTGRWVTVPESSSAALGGHALLTWDFGTPTYGVHTYGLGFHGFDADSYALTLAVARSMKLVKPSTACPPGYECG